MIKKIVFSFLFFITISAYSQQEKLNNYKYIIVQEKFDFLKKPDQYQTSSLTKFLLKKTGFTVFLSNETLPKELLQNRCLALTANVVDDSSMFTVKNKIEFKDCFGTVIYTSNVGKSKEKEYKKSYHESIRNAYESMADIEYAYKPNNHIINTVEDIKLDEISSTKKVTPVKASPEVKVVVPVEKVVSNEVITALPKTSNTIETLYAQVKPTGFQLVNTTPSIVFQALKTNVKDVFVLKDKNGILYKDNNNWVAEYYENNKKTVKKYIIKF